MAEYIERNKAVDAIAHLMATGFVEDRFITPHELQSLQDELETLPAADVALVVHGQWIKGVPVGFSGKPDGYRCSVCETVILGMPPLYCQRCGSKMDKEDTDGD